MAKARYTVKESKVEEGGTGGRGKLVSMYQVWDGTRRCVAHGTKGANGTGGYKSKREAQHIADMRNETEENMRARRGKNK